MRTLSNISLVFGDKIIAVLSFFAFFFTVAFADNPTTSAIINQKWITWYFALACMMALIANAVFYFAVIFEKKSFLMRTLFVGSSIGGLLFFVAGCYAYIHIEDYLLEYRTSVKEAVTTKLSFILNENSFNVTDFGYVLLHKSLLSDIAFKQFERLCENHADIVFADGVYDIYTLDQKEKNILHYKNQSLGEILLMERDYTLLNTIAPFINDPNYRNPQYIGVISSLNTSLFEKIVHEYISYDYADVGETIATLLLRGADRNIVDKEGRDLVTQLIVKKDLIEKKLNSNPEGETVNLYHKKIEEIDSLVTLLGGVPDTVLQ